MSIIIWSCVHSDAAKWGDNTKGDPTLLRCIDDIGKGSNELESPRRVFDEKGPMWGRLYIAPAHEMHLKEFFKAADTCSSQYVGTVDYANFAGHSFGNEAEARAVNP